MVRRKFLVTFYRINILRRIALPALECSPVDKPRRFEFLQ
jgi:hypothetical protein